MTEFDYTPPVSKLLTLGDCREMSRWPNYLDLGFTMEHVSELIRLAQEWSEAWWDRTDDIAVWGPVHAWRVLGKLRAESAIEPLVGVMARTDDLNEDWIMEELPGVFGMIGLPAIPALSDALADSSLGLWARITTAHSLECVGNAHPETRDDCITAMTRTLTRFSELDPTLNAFIISYLVGLKAVEAAPLMEQAFAADNVDWSVHGDWEDIQIDLGLLERRQTPRPNYFLEGMRVTQPKPRKTSSRSKRKAKRKQQRAARRKQRKRKRKK